MNQRREETPFIYTGRGMGSGEIESSSTLASVDDAGNKTCLEAELAQDSLDRVEAAIEALLARARLGHPGC